MEHHIIMFMSLTDQTADQSMLQNESPYSFICALCCVPFNVIQ